MAELGVETAYILCSQLAAVWVLISAGEGFATIREVRKGGTYDARIVVPTAAGAALSRLDGVTTGTSAYVLSLAMRSVGGGLLLIYPTLGTITVGWCFVASATLYARWRRGFGDDGSDQMLTIMSVTFALALLLRGGDGVLEAGLLFIGAQACLAYTAAGVAKLVSPVWRGGHAIPGVVATRTYGLRPLSTLVRSIPGLALILCWGTIAFESSFVLAPFLPSVLLLGLLATAAAFHVGTALVMGLNGFLWAFVATYPAIVFLNQTVTGILG